MKTLLKIACFVVMPPVVALTAVVWTVSIVNDALCGLLRSYWDLVIE